MKKIVLIFSIIVLVISCKDEPLSADRFKTGTFEIPAGKGYEKTIIVRKDSLQIETYEDRIDTLSISWKNNFNYTLKMIHPKTAIDEDPIHIKITNIEKNSYEFEAVIGHSNFIQKGEIIKILD
ncbi:hypothetical protein SAMN06265371_11155 [Lutibacter agarilyticus]|uniref:Uncharacterized protein n=1 Tax=Lutibacter agarilyticus TaxID=1109740 RepID=A0A238YW67_9FLAO|nr:hypothetical protein [Lutibacter agarilyticus]SNR75377.1 hypothetical protein SAMN06265371_11155 [Lutibacter agarilyticus]